MQVLIAASLVAVTLFAAPANRVTATPIGDDLTESLEGWTLVEESGSAGNWSQFDVTGSGPFTSPISENSVLDGTSGDFYFIKDQSMPSAGVLYIPLAIPASGDILLRFDYFVQSQASRAIPDGGSMSHTVFPNQQFRVDIIEEVPTDWFTALPVVVSVVTPTAGSSFPATEWNSIDINLSSQLNSLRGETVYLAFREVDNQGFLTVGIDNVQFSGANVGNSMCDEPSVGVEEFACSIATDPKTITSATVLGDPPPGPFDGYNALGAGTVSPPYSAGGWRPFDPTIDPPDEPLMGTLPSAIDGEYYLFEHGASASDRLDGTYSIPFTIDATATTAQLGFYYFLQSQSDPKIIGDGNAIDPLDTNDQRFIVTIEGTAPVLTEQLVFEASETTEIDGVGVWNSQWIDLFEVTGIDPDITQDQDFTLTFTAVAGAGGMQAGVDIVNVYTDVRDNTKKTFGVREEELLAFPRQGGKYGVMSTGDAESVEPAGSQSDFVSGAFGGDDYAESNTLHDLTRISIELAPPLGSQCLSLDIRFLSEEYPEYVGSRFNDAFLAELNPEELAPGEGSWSVIEDDPGTPESELAINAPSNFAAAPTSDGLDTTVLSINTTNTGWFSSEFGVGSPFNGGSNLLRATVPVDPAATTAELVLTIFDQGDQSFDSAVLLDALTFWPNAECAGQFGAPDPSTGVDVIAPQAAWLPVEDSEVYVTDLPLTLNLEFDQPVDTVLDSDILNVGDAEGCVFDVTAENPNAEESDDGIPDGSATEFTVLVTECGVGELQPQLEAGTVSGPAANVGPAFNVTSFPITIRRVRSGGGSTPTPSASISASPSASPSASLKPTPSASVTPTTAPTYSASPIASSSASPSAAPSVKPSPTPSGSSSQSGGGGTSGNGDGGGWTLPTLPTLDQLANNFWFGVLLGAIVVLALWGLTNGLQRRVDSAPDEA